MTTRATGPLASPQSRPAGRSGSIPSRCSGQDKPLGHPVEAARGRCPGCARSGARRTSERTASTTGTIPDSPRVNRPDRTECYVPRALEPCQPRPWNQGSLRVLTCSQTDPDRPIRRATPSGRLSDSLPKPMERSWLPTSSLGYRHRPRTSHRNRFQGGSSAFVTRWQPSTERLVESEAGSPPRHGGAILPLQRLPGALVHALDAVTRPQHSAALEATALHRFDDLTYEQTNPLLVCAPATSAARAGKRRRAGRLTPTRWCRAACS